MIGVASFLGLMLILCGKNIKWTPQTLQELQTNTVSGSAGVATQLRSGVHANMLTIAWSTKANLLPPRCPKPNQKADRP